MRAISWLGTYCFCRYRIQRPEDWGSTSLRWMSEMATKWCAPGSRRSAYCIAWKCLAGNDRCARQFAPSVQKMMRQNASPQDGNRGRLHPPRCAGTPLRSLAPTLCRNAIAEPCTHVVPERHCGALHPHCAGTALGAKPVVPEQHWGRSPTLCRNSNGGEARRCAGTALGRSPTLRRNSTGGEARRC